MYRGFLTVCIFALLYLSSCSVLNAKNGIGLDILEGGKETPFEEAFWLRGQFFCIHCKATSRDVDSLPYSATPLIDAPIQVICHDLRRVVSATTNDFGMFEVELPDSHTFNISMTTKCSLHLTSSLVTKCNTVEVHISRGPLGDHVFTRMKKVKETAVLYEMQRFDYVSSTCEQAPLYGRRQLEHVDDPYYGEYRNSPYGARSGFPVPPSPPAPPPEPTYPYFRPTYPNFPPYEITPPSPPPPCGCPCDCPCESTP